MMGTRVRVLGLGGLIDVREGLDARHMAIHGHGRGSGVHPASDEQRGWGRALGGLGLACLLQGPGTQ